MKLFRHITGWQRLRLEGADVCRILSLLTAAGVSFWDVQRPDAFSLSLCLSRKNAGAAAEIAAKHGFDCTAEFEKGAAYFWRRIRPRKALLSAAGLCALLLLAGKLFIWQIEIPDCAGIPTGELRMALAECGVDTGSCRLGFSQDLTRNALLRRLPRLRWATVNIRGCCAEVILRPKRQAALCLNENVSRDITASAAGYVTELCALQGTAVIESQQAVQQGQLLIAGVARGRSGVQGEVCAVGTVWAQTVRELTAAAPLQGEKRAVERPETRRWALIIGKNRINFYKSYSICPDDCAKMIQEEYFALSSLPVALLRLCVYGDNRTQSASAVSLQQLQSSLTRRLTASLGDGEILSCRFSCWEQDGWLYVTAHAKCSENIAEVSAEKTNYPLTEEYDP